MTNSTVSSGVVSNGGTVQNGNTLTVDGGGTAVSTIVQGGGLLVVSSAGVTSFTQLSGTVIGGGFYLASVEVVSSGGQSTSATVVLGQQTVLDGGVASGTVLDNSGFLVVSSGGSTVSASANSGGIVTVSSGGTATAVSANAADVEVLAGGTASGTVLSAGPSAPQAGSENVQSGGLAISAQMMAGGVELVHSGGIEQNATAFSGGVISVNGGSALDATVSNGGSLSMMFSGGGLVSSLTVDSGGQQDVAGTTSGAIIANSGAQYVLGGTATGTEVQSGGSQVIIIGAASNTTVDAGGTATVVGGAALDGATVSGVVSVTAGASGTGLTVGNGGSAVVGGSVTSVTVNSGGFEVISAGGIASLTDLARGGALDLVSLSYATGGTASVDSSDMLTISVGGQTYQQQLTGSYTGDSFQFAEDAAGGTEVTPEAATPSSPAIATIQTGVPVDLGAVHLGATAQQTLDIANTATPPADFLDGQVSSVLGNVTASGSFTGLAAGAAGSTAIIVGLDTSTAGAKSGTVSLAFATDDGVGDTSPLPDQDIAVSGTVFRQAAATIAPISTILHVGDSGVLSLAVANSAINDGYSEALIASIAPTDGVVTAASSGPTGDILAGGTNATALTIAVPTATAGIETGTATVDLTSDGGTGADSIDGLGQSGLGTDAVPVSVTIDNYAVAGLSSSGPTLTAGTAAGSYVLNLGTVQAGTTVTAVALNALNTAAGLADALNGTFSVSSNGAFINSGFGGLSNLAAQSSTTAGTIALNTSQSGTFSETITFDPTDVNATGFSEAQAPEVVTVIADVIPAASAQGDVHMVTFDGLHYNFQAVGDFTLVQSTVADNPFDVQIRTSAFPVNGLVSVTTMVAAQVGDNSLVFGLDGGVTVNGVTDTAWGGTATTQQFDGGQLVALSANTDQIDWTNGAVLTITNAGLYFNLSMTLAAGDHPGSVEGLLGSDSGQASDFQLPNGTTLATPVSNAEILSTFANAWTVAPDQSMLTGATVTPLAATDLLLSQSMDFLPADGPGDILTGSLGTTSAGVTYAGTMANLAGDVLAGFTAGDAIDVTDLSSGQASLDFVSSGDGGNLTIASGSANLLLHVSGTAPANGFAIASDQHGGSLITAL